MAKFLSAQTLNEAVESLAVCSAQSTLADYLIFKRALKLIQDAAREQGSPEPATVVTGTRSEPFVRAIDELTRTWPAEVPGGDSKSPYYVPFGSARDSASRGYKTKKYPSNGPSDTVGRWQSRAGTPLTLIAGTSPKEYKFVSRSVIELRTFFMIARAAGDESSGSRPSLLDTSVWWYRFSDLEPRFGEAPTSEQLTAGFIADLSLTDTEVDAFFAKARAAESPVDTESVAPEGAS